MNVLNEKVCSEDRGSPNPKTREGAQLLLAHEAKPTRDRSWTRAKQGNARKVSAGAGREHNRQGAQDKAPDNKLVRVSCKHRQTPLNDPEQRPGATEGRLPTATP